jgi:hypothetical protein
MLASASLRNLMNNPSTSPRVTESLTSALRRYVLSNPSAAGGRRSAKSSWSTSLSQKSLPVVLIARSLSSSSGPINTNTLLHVRIYGSHPSQLLVTLLDTGSMNTTSVDPDDMRLGLQSEMALRSYRVRSDLDWRPSIEVGSVTLWSPDVFYGVLRDIAVQECMGWCDVNWTWFMTRLKIDKPYLSWAVTERSVQIALFLEHFILEV